MPIRILGKFSVPRLRIMESILCGPRTPPPGRRRSLPAGRSDHRNDNQIGGGKLVPIQQRVHSLPAQVHVGLRFDQDNLLPVYLPLTRECFKHFLAHSNPMIFASRSITIKPTLCLVPAYSLPGLRGCNQFHLRHLRFTLPYFNTSGSLRKAFSR